MTVKTWDIKLLKDKLKNYQRLLEKAKTKEDRETFLKIVRSYKSFIEDYYAPRKADSFISTARKDNAYLEKVTNTLPLLINANSYIISNNINLKSEIPQIKIEKDKILTITRDFYQNINGIFLEKYQEYYDIDSIYINFLKPIGNDLGGNIVRPEGATEAYININTYNGLYDVASSIHEHGHAIGASINEQHLNNPLTREVEPIFFELLGLEEIDRQDYSYEDILGSKEASVSLYHSCLNTVDAKYITTLSGIMDKNKATEIIQKKYDIEKDYIDDIFIEPLESVVNYSLSFLIAVELYVLYRRNSFAALKILEDIIRANKTNEKELLSQLKALGITPGKSLKSFYKQYLNIKGTSKKLH